MSYAHNNLGTVLLDRGRIEEALEQFRTSIAIKETLLAAQPENDALKIELGDSYSWLGSVLQARGELDAALDMHRADVAVTEAALALDPANADFQWRLSAALHLLGELQEDLGDLCGGDGELRTGAGDQHRAGRSRSR